MKLLLSFLIVLFLAGCNETYAATLTVYSTTGDGMVGNNNQTTWDIAHDTDPGATTSSGAEETINASKFTDSNWSVYHLHFPFDTSSIGGTAVISAATLSLYAITIVNTNSASVGVLLSTQGSSPPAAADFDKCSTINTPTEGATRVTLASMSTAQYNDMPLNATGLTYVSGTGTTSLCNRMSNDMDDSAPTGENSLLVYMNFQAGTTEDPKLVVTYSEPSTFTPKAIIIE